MGLGELRTLSDRAPGFFGDWKDFLFSRESCLCKLRDVQAACDEAEGHAGLRSHVLQEGHVLSPQPRHLVPFQFRFPNP